MSRHAAFEVEEATCPWLLFKYYRANSGFFALKVGRCEMTSILIGSNIWRVHHVSAGSWVQRKIDQITPSESRRSHRKRRGEAGTCTSTCRSPHVLAYEATTPLFEHAYWYSFA